MRAGRPTGKVVLGLANPAETSAVMAPSTLFATLAGLSVSLGLFRPDQPGLRKDAVR